MKGLAVLMLVVLISAVTVNSFQCWLCKASVNGPKSFADCNAKLMKQNCSAKETVCAMFIYKSKTGVLIHAKSCTLQRYCGSNGTFCGNINLGGSDCRLECCGPELCNNKQEFKSTTPAPTTLPTETDKRTTEEKTTPAQTTEKETTTKETTTLETELPSHETSAPDYDDEDDDCSWIDAGSTHLISGVILLACAMSATL